MTCIALLRAVNVAGRNKIRMHDLRDLLTGLGMRDVRWLLQSGNLVFETERARKESLEGRLERAAEERLGLATDFLVRSSRDWNRVVAGNPFPREAERDPSHLLVMFLKSAPGPAKAGSLRAAIRGREVVRTDGQQTYITYPDGIGRSRLTTSVIEEKLGVRGTGRNWNTVLKLQAMLKG